MSQVVSFAESAEVNAEGFAKGATMTGLRSVPVLNRLVSKFAIATVPTEGAF
jgi:hypothetical protein